MLYTITVTATYEADADTVFAGALDFSEMQDAMRGLAVYEGLPDAPIQQGDTIVVDVTMFRFLKTRGHHMYVELLDRAARIVQSREHNPNIKRWDHRLSVQPHNAGCIWTDTIVLDAGFTTFMAARFCRFVYARRHRLREAKTLETKIVKGGDVDAIAGSH